MNEHFLNGFEKNAFVMPLLKGVGKLAWGAAKGSVAPLKKIVSNPMKSLGAAATTYEVGAAAKSGSKTVMKGKGLGGLSMRASSNPMAQRMQTF